MLANEDLKYLSWQSNDVLELDKVLECVQKVYSKKSYGKTAVWTSVEYHFEKEKAVMDIHNGYVMGENSTEQKCSITSHFGNLDVFNRPILIKY